MKTDAGVTKKLPVATPDDIVLTDRISIATLLRTSIRLDWLEAIHRRYGASGLPATREGSTFLLRLFAGHIDAADITWLFDLMKPGDAIAFVMARFNTFPSFVGTDVGTLTQCDSGQLSAARDRFEAAELGIVAATGTRVRTASIAAAYRHLSIALIFTVSRTDPKMESILTAQRRSLHLAHALTHAMMASGSATNNVQIGDMFDLALPLAL